MPDEKKPDIPSFREFIDSVQAARHQDFAQRAGSRVAHEDAFAEMRAHILKLYDRVEVRHSFVDENGSIFDCIPVEQQPALRNSTEPLAKAPDLPPLERPAGARSEREDLSVAPPLEPGRKDRYGNTMHCPEGTIPMRRVTLEDLSRFEDLKHFFQKSPVGKGRHPRLSVPEPGAPGVAATHRWAHAYQNANNLGGHSFLNLWDPAIGANQIFSLSQHWYVGGSGAGLQTAEVGWQVYPQFYGNSRPVFFIYWTADDYNTTGCYNLTCSAFVQTSSSWTIGGTISPWSTIGGAQYSLEVAFYLYGGRWWLYVRGTQSSNAIGYYPVSIYRNGAMASHASEIDYGGETVGTTSFPPMGSGRFANTGWQQAAYQRTIYYYPTGGGAVYANLTPSQGWPSCYTAQVTNYASPWYESLWFGGPGGNC